MLRVAGKAPGAIKLEKQWMQGIPKDPERIRQYINDTYAYDEPLLTMMAHGKPRRALGAMLRHNLDPEQSELGIGLKALVGLVYANHANNKHLIDRARTLADHYGVDPELVKAVDTFDPGSADDGLDVRTRAALTAAHAMAPSPAVVDQAAVDTIAASLSSAEIVETAVWVSVNQLVHRLSVFFEQAD
jgi:alkylhydroperoxidase family enzyme